MRSIKFVLKAIMAVSLITVSPAFAQDEVDSDEAPVASGSSLSQCLSAIEAERERASQDHTCDEAALRRIRRDCAGQETQAIAHFRRLMEMCGMDTDGADTLGDIFNRIDCQEPTSPAPTWRPRPGCGQTESGDDESDGGGETRPPRRPRTRVRYICIDDAVPVDVRGNPVEDGRRPHHCDCPEPRREVNVDYRTVRTELGHPNGVRVTTCTADNDTAEGMAREDVERMIERIIGPRIERIERICTDEEGERTDTGQEPLLCREIWTLIERVSANSASIETLDTAITRLEEQVSANTAGVRRHDETEADRCGVPVEEWIAMSREERRDRCRIETNSEVDLDRFRLVLGARVPIRFETGVVSAYGIFGAEWAPRFTENFGLYARGYVGYGSYGDVPDQTGEVPLGESGLWGLAAGLEIEPLPNLTLDVGVAFDSSLIEGQRGNAFGTYRWHSLGPEVRIRFNLHEHFFIEGNVGAAWNRTVVNSNNVLIDVDGFGLNLGAAVGASF